MARKTIKAVEEAKTVRAHVLKPKYNQDTYEYSDAFEPWNGVDTNQIHTPHELVEAVRKGKAEVDCITLGINTRLNQWTFKRLDTKEFIEAWDNGDKRWDSKFKLKESFGNDIGSEGGYGQNGYGPSNAGLVGDDFIPSLGGPFYKQLYQYDYIRMHNLCFFAAHHDPFARAIVSITRDFTLGRGFRIDSDNKAALALWRAFEEVNDLQGMMDQAARELCCYGEVMFWELPGNETNIVYRPTDTQKVNHGLIPRIRMIDPSCIWDITTWPEDIKKVLSYTWIAPTQYQTYAGLTPESKGIPSSKFIFQSIPADQVTHWKVNAFGGEKRGRSDLFPILGYAKRLRDSVAFQILSLQKQAAWTMDTTVQGSQADVDAYASEMAALGTLPPAGSEFIHTDKITRQFLSNVAGKGGQSEAFEWCLSMIAAGSGIPSNYFGTHLSGGQTRASALVATEPVAKKFEMRQVLYQQMIQRMWDNLMKKFGLGKVECEITFPEILVQDRSAKLKDLALAETQGWISKERAATIAAKELGITNFGYDDEKEDMAGEVGDDIAVGPLTDVTGSDDNTEKPTGVSSSMRKDIASLG